MTWSSLWVCSNTSARDRRNSDRSGPSCARSRACLRPGGSLLLAIENRLGVKYLAGAGEDHTGKVYDSVEGYPEGTIARTFSRSELSGLLESAGLDPSFYNAFPDYKVPRAILADPLFAAVPPLAWRIPVFPSPDRGGNRSRTIDEDRLWRALVQDGVGPGFGNSYLVVAKKGPDRADTESLWPAGQLAAFYQPERRAPYATQTLVCERDGTTIFRRSLLRLSPAEPRSQVTRLQDQGADPRGERAGPRNRSSRGPRGGRRRSAGFLLAADGLPSPTARRHDEEAMNPISSRTTSLKRVTGPLRSSTVNGSRRHYHATSSSLGAC